VKLDGVAAGAGTVCTRGSNRTPSRGPSTSPLDAAGMAWSGGLVLRLTW
jgi:hypothetical protein